MNIISLNQETPKLHRSTLSSLTAILLRILAAVVILQSACHKDGPCINCPPTGLDTTSHNFIWHIDTLGDGSGAALFDVAVVNDMLAYAVGEIASRNDSTGQLEQSYGVAIWNGTKWNLKRLSALGPTGITSNLVPTGVWAFSESNVWFASGGVFFWNGQSSTTTPYWINPFPGNPSPILSTGQSAEKVWGSSSSDLYAVGRKGGVARFNGSNWQKLESGTSLEIQNISGRANPQSGSQEVLAVASDRFTTNGVAILKLSTTQVTMLSNVGLPVYSMVSIWSPNSSAYYVCGDGFYRTDDPRSSWKSDTVLPQIYTESVRGNSVNDIFVVGDFGLVLHWNGASWHEYSGAELNYFQGAFYAVAVKGNTMIAIGSLNNGRAIALSGRR